MVLHAGVLERFVQRFVAVAQVDVLADHGDVHLALRVLGFIDQIVPALEVGRRCVQAQLVADQPIQTLLVQHARHLVDGVGVPHRDHAPFSDVGEQRNLVALVVRNAAVGAAQQGVRLYADFAQFLHRVLGRLGLELAGRRDPRHVGQVDEGAVVRPQAQAELTHGFEEGQGFDVTDGAADFDDGHVHRIRLAKSRTAFDVFLDFVGDVRNHLHGFAEIVTPAFLLQHRLVDSAGGEVVFPAHAGVDEAFVVAQVQVGFGAVVGHEHFAMLERRHGAGVDIDVGIELDQRDFEAPRLQNRSKGGRGDSLAQGGHHTAGDEDKFGHVRARA